MTSWAIIFWERAEGKSGGVFARSPLSSRAVPWRQAGLASCSRNTPPGAHAAGLVFQLPEEPRPAGTSGVPVKDPGRIPRVTALAALPAD